MELSNLFTVPSFWFDIICIVVLVILCARYVRLGFLAAVVQISGTVLSLTGAHLFASFADSIVYEKCLATILQERVEHAVLESSTQGLNALSGVLASGGTLDTLLHAVPEQVLPALPEAFWVMLQQTDLQVPTLDLSGATEAIIQGLMDNVISLVAVQMIYLVLFLLAFVVLRLLFFLLVQALKSVNAIPFFGGINRALGWVLGIVGASVDLFLMLCLVWVVILFTENTLPVINTAELGNSVFFILFQQLNPFV